MLLGRYGLSLETVHVGQSIPGSYWGEEEAGLIRRSNNYFILARADTPLHSVLHESCHFVCMDEQRRQALGEVNDPEAGNAGGDYDEENAVCFLQIILADQLPGMDRLKMCADMDRWGYTFRLGSALSWFTRDADDARQWLLEAHLIDDGNNPTFRVR
jgi:hypothetical protein